MDDTHTGAIRADEREYITRLLARYPAISQDETNELKTWFTRGATALDLGLVASDPRAAIQFRAFREQHVDRFTVTDVAKALAFVSVIALVMLVVVARMP
jgi:hypothetical protein